MKLRAVLEKFFIGDVAHEAGSSAPLEDELAEGTFYHTMKQRVHAYFQAQKVMRTDSSPVVCSIGSPHHHGFSACHRCLQLIAGPWESGTG